MSPGRKTALIAGLFFIGTFITAIGGLVLYDPVLNDTDYIVGDGSDTRVTLGALLEIFLVITNIGTAVVLFPLLRLQSESAALGFVASRIVGGTIIAVGIMSLLSIVTLRHFFEDAGADSGSLDIAGQSLVALHDWTFLGGPGFCVAVGNGLLLGYLMYRSGLVARPMAIVGLIGSPPRRQRWLALGSRGARRAAAFATAFASVSAVRRASRATAARSGRNAKRAFGAIGSRENSRRCGFLT